MAEPLLLAAGLLLAGAVAGLGGALLGVGGGVLVVPVLYLGLGVPLPVAVGTSLVVITGTSVAGTAGYLRRGWVEVDLAMGLQVGALAGALAAAWVAVLLAEQVVARIFAAFLVATAVNLWWRGRRDPGGEMAATGGRRRAGYALSPLGGVAAGLLGVGGGLVQVPILRLLLGLEMRRAVATSTLTVGLTASVAALVYLRRGDVEMTAAPWLLAGILAGALGAPRLLGALPRRAVELAFSALLLYAAYRMVG